MYFSYFVLFARFFYKSYVNRGTSKHSQSDNSIPGGYTSNKSDKIKSN